MSIIKSSAENLTLNADGANNDIIFQSNGSNIATLDQAGLLTATSFSGDGSNLTSVAATDSSKLPLAGGTMTGTIAGFTSTGIDDNANATAITISNAERVTIDSTAGTDTLTLNRNGGNDGWATLGFPSAKFEIDAKSAMKVAVDGTQKLYLTTAGLAFNSDTASANSLNDYEEGDFTPELVSTSAYSGQVYAYQQGSYTKIGDRVFFNIYIKYSDKGTLSGNYMKIIGLPFTPSASPIYEAVTINAQNDGRTSPEIPAGNVYSANTFLYLYNQTTTLTTQVGLGQMSDTTAYRISGHYNI